MLQTDGRVGGIKRERERDGGVEEGWWWWWWGNRVTCGLGRRTEGDSVRAVSSSCENREYQRQKGATREERGVEGINKESQRERLRGEESRRASEETFRFQERYCTKIVQLVLGVCLSPHVIYQPCLLTVFKEWLGPFEF